MRMLSIKRPHTWSDFLHVISGGEASFLSLGLDGPWRVKATDALLVYEEVCLPVNRSHFWRVRLELEDALGL